MQTEIEAKWLDIDKNELRAKLKKIGAELVHPERLMRRSNWDYPDRALARKGGWVRVRDESDKVTLSYKQTTDYSLHGTQEINLIVDDFDTSIQFLKTLGLEQKSYQETRRESWRLGETEIELDTWPWIPPFIEIEAADEASLKRVAEMLELDMGQASHGSVEKAYQAVFDVSTDKLVHTEILFTHVPDWLEKKRK